jgi:hypothetical protein
MPRSVLAGPNNVVSKLMTPIVCETFGHERSGGGVAPIAEHLDCDQHPIASLRPDGGVVVEHSRHSLVPDAGDLRNVGHPRRGETPHR